MAKLDFLLVEDSINDVHMIKRIISKESLAANYVWVEDGEKAINYLLSAPKDAPTVVLLDIKLPKVDGLEVLKTLKANRLTRHIPVVMFSSSSQERDIKEAYTHGANSYLTKPSTFSEFKVTITSFIKYWLNLNKTVTT